MERQRYISWRRIKTPVEAIEGLMALGADIKAKDTGGKTAGKVAVIESLVPHDEADAKQQTRIFWRFHRKASVY
jgi:hypothetical protein